MSEYIPQNQWHPAIRQFDINEIVEGGEAGLDNIPHHQLADCVWHLLDRIVKNENSIKAILQGVTPNITPGVGEETPLPDANPLGEWTIEGFSKVSALSTFGLFFVTLKHSSGQQIAGVRPSSEQIRASDGYLGGVSSTSRNGSDAGYTTDAEGRVTLPFYIGHRPDGWPEMNIKVEAPNTTTFESRLYIWNGVPANLTPGSGGNANQTE